VEVVLNHLLQKVMKIKLDINKDGSGYTIKEGPNKGKTLAHIRIPTRGI
jgi:hypothetical protein